MIVVFESVEEFVVMNKIVSTFEESDLRKKLSPNSLFVKVLDDLLDEVDIQRHTSLGYKSQYVTCSECECDWHALYYEDDQYINCPNCMNKITFNKDA